MDIYTQKKDDTSVCTYMRNNDINASWGNVDNGSWAGATEQGVQFTGGVIMCLRYRGEQRAANLLYKGFGVFQPWPE